MRTLQDIRATLPVYPVEVEFPDLTQWRQGNTGVDYVHTFDSGKPGPHAMVMALTHGNEVSGAIALDTLLRARVLPQRGRITLGFANVEAYGRFSYDDPDAARFLEEDLNRVWAPARLDGSEDSLELRRARALRPVIDTVDFLLDLHSMHEAAPALGLAGPLEKGLRFAREVGVPEHVIVDAGHANGTRMRDYGDFGDPASPRNALLIETGQHFAALSRDVALDAAVRFLLRQTGAVAQRDLGTLLLGGAPAAQRAFEVTQAVVAQTMDFAFAEDYRGLERIARAGTVIARDTGREIVTPYDDCVIIMPSLRHLGQGVTVVRLAREVAMAPAA